IALPGVHVRANDEKCLVVKREGILEEALTTRDLVEITPQGFLWIGRADNAIITGGVNVFPEEVERKLASVLTVNFFVAGIPHPELGEQVALFVEGIENKATPDWKELGLTPFQKPRSVIAMPKFLYTNSG